MRVEIISMFADSPPMASEPTGSIHYIRMAAENLRKAQESSDCSICKKLIGEQESAVSRLSTLMQQAEEYMALQKSIEDELEGMERGARRTMKRERSARSGMFNLGGGLRDMMQNRVRITDMLNIGGGR
jgi:hypothetical protein